MSILLRLSFIYRILFDLESFVYSSSSLVGAKSNAGMKNESVRCLARCLINASEMKGEAKNGNFYQTRVHPFSNCCHVQRCGISMKAMETYYLFQILWHFYAIII